MSQLRFPIQWPRVPRLARVRFADRPARKPRPRVRSLRLFVRCGRHGLVHRGRHRLGFDACGKCHRAGA